MPVMMTENPVSFDDIPNRIKWTVQQCDALRDAGFLTARYELIDGEIISKMGQKPPHAVAVNLLMTWLVAVFGGVRVRVQALIDITSAGTQVDEPEPDAVVTAKGTSDYIERHPGAADIMLLVEVSDTTLRLDRSVKASLYARASIQEYWVADVTGRQIYVHRQPSPHGYSDIKAYAADENVSPLSSPNASVKVSSLLPPAD